VLKAAVTPNANKFGKSWFLVVVDDLVPVVEIQLSLKDLKQIRLK